MLTASVERSAGEALNVDPRWAWSPYRPSAGAPWDTERAWRLLSRLGFAPRHGELASVLRRGPQAALAELFQAAQRAADFNATFDEYERAAGEGNDTSALRTWWLRRILQTPAPLLERMTLFWHGHFALSGARVGSASLMARHIQLLRKHALGHFDDLLHAVLHDPAFYAGLSARENRKARPNRYFARVLLSQHTVGRGAFTEADVTAVARAVTGMCVQSGRLRFREREHDRNQKCVLGAGGIRTAGDLARALAQHEKTARFIVRKLCRAFLTEYHELPDQLLEPLVREFQKDRDIGRLVRTIGGSNFFFSPLVRSCSVKSPVVWAAGIGRAFEALLPTVALAEDLGAVGQRLCEAPTVRGWAGGRAWLAPAALSGRLRLAQALFFNTTRYGGKLNPYGLSQRYGCRNPREIVRFLIDLLWGGRGEAKIVEKLTSFVAESRFAGERERVLRQVGCVLVTAPRFQVM